MTRILTSQQVTRETEGRANGRELLIRLWPRYIEIWPKLRPSSKYRMSYEKLYELARQVEAHTFGGRRV